jgi:N-acyl-phosphatidylethanolamine-hydrolysing phospholipase D
VNPYYDPAKPHHRRQGFQNNYIEFEPKSLAQVLRWRLDAHKAGLPRPPASPTPTVIPDVVALHKYASDPRAPSVTWVGHATALVQMGGLSVLTDPMFSNRASPVAFAGPRRHQPPGLGLNDLPHIDLVLVSHNHYDHLDEASAVALQNQRGGPPLFVVPLGLKPWLASRGIANAIELDWWDNHRMPQADVEVVLVPAQHWSSRSLGDQLATLWGGFAVFSPDCHMFFAGDTGYSRDFTDIATRFAGRQSPELGGGFDLALLPIGAYEPRWFMTEQHVNVKESLQIHRDLGAKRSLGIHWGTFQLTDESLDAPPAELAVQRERLGLAEDDFFVLALGETRVLPARS